MTQTLCPRFNTNNSENRRIEDIWNLIRYRRSRIQEQTKKKHLDYWRGVGHDFEVSLSLAATGAVDEGEGTQTMPMAESPSFFTSLDHAVAARLGEAVQFPPPQVSDVQFA